MAYGFVSKDSDNNGRSFAPISPHSEIKVTTVKNALGDLSNQIKLFNITFVRFDGQSIVIEMHLWTETSIKRFSKFS